MLVWVKVNARPEQKLYSSVLDLYYVLPKNHKYFQIKELPLYALNGCYQLIWGLLQLLSASSSPDSIQADLPFLQEATHGVFPG